MPKSFLPKRLHCSNPLFSRSFAFTALLSQRTAVGYSPCFKPLDPAQLRPQLLCTQHQGHKTADNTVRTSAQPTKPTKPTTKKAPILTHCPADRTIHRTDLSKLKAQPQRQKGQRSLYCFRPTQLHTTHTSVTAMSSKKCSCARP